MMSRLPSDLYESMCFPTAFLTLCFIGWSHDMMANVPGKGLSSGTKLTKGTFTAGEAVVPGG